MKQLMIFGDSILRGITYSEEMKKYRLCAGYKLPSLTELGYDVVNHSRMGATVTRGLDMLDGGLPQCDNDTVILLEYGGNDCDHNWDEVAANPAVMHLPNTPEAEFIRKYSTAIERTLATGATVIMCPLLPIDADKYMNWISQKRSREDILRWLGDVSMLYRFQEHYNDLVEQLARTYGCPLLGYRKDFLLSHRYSDLMCRDGIHPTEAGHDLIEASVANFLKDSRILCA